MPCNALVSHYCDINDVLCPEGADRQTKYMIQSRVGISGNLENMQILLKTLSLATTTIRWKRRQISGGYLLPAINLGEDSKMSEEPDYFLELCQSLLLDKITLLCLSL